MKEEARVRRCPGFACIFGHEEGKEGRLVYCLAIPQLVFCLFSCHQLAGCPVLCWLQPRVRMNLWPSCVCVDLD